MGELNLQEIPSIGRESYFKIKGITTNVEGATIQRIIFFHGQEEREIPPAKKTDRCWYIAAFQTLVSHHKGILNGSNEEIVSTINRLKPEKQGKKMISLVEEHAEYLQSKGSNDDPYEKDVKIIIGAKQYYLYTGHSNGKNWAFVGDYLKKLNEKIKEKGSLQPISMKIDYIPQSVNQKNDNSKGKNGGDSVENKVKDQLVDLIDNGIHQIVLTGAPGTGKTYHAREVAKHFASLTSEDLKKRFEFVQFHPSYDYTDFVEGLRPVDVGGKMQFKRMDGIFMKFCRYVAWRNKCKEEEIRKNDKCHENCVSDTDCTQCEKYGLSSDCKAYEAYKAWVDENKFFFVIDEINRADLSKVFGELMFCLEGDKRGKENGIKTQYANLTTYHLFDKNDEVRLKELTKICEWKQKESDTEQKFTKQDEFYYTCFDGGFYIPENVVIIGTMNDIDRSVESMDFALRRRFTWIKVDVDETSLKEAFRNGKFFDAAGDQKAKIAKEIAARVHAFNKSDNTFKKHHLGEEYYISQGQFSGIPTYVFEEQNDTSEDMQLFNRVMEWVWEYRVKSLLREYLRGSSIDVEKELGEDGALWGKWFKKSTSTNEEPPNAGKQEEVTSNTPLQGQQE